MSPARISAVLAIAAIWAAPGWAKECGLDPGPPQPVRVENCDIRIVMGDLKRLVESYRHRACMTSVRDLDSADDAMAAERKRAQALLSDPKLREHLNLCIGRAN
ncbi:MAG: hypothetical protein ACT4N4_12325 [Rhodospirillales bacterium]